MEKTTRQILKGNKMAKELTPEEIKEMKIAHLRWLQKRYHQMDKEEKMSNHERAHLGLHAMELQIRRDQMKGDIGR